jgi:hypothetical protein
LLDKKNLFVAMHVIPNMRYCNHIVAMIVI